MLDGQLAIVTGGGSGIGRATAEALALRGARVATWDVSGAEVFCDVRSEESVRAAMGITLERFGVPSILVASAGVGGFGNIVDISIADWDRIYSVNVRGVFLSLQVVVQQMSAHHLEGSVVLVSSVNGTIADPGHSMYSTGKAAVSHLARCAAVELGGQGIRVNAVAVGPTDTPMMGEALASRGYAERIAETTPLGRVGLPDDIAEGIVNIIESRWVTGQVIALDGGASLVTPRGTERARRMITASEPRREE